MQSLRLYRALHKREQRREPFIGSEAEFVCGVLISAIVLCVVFAL